MSTGDVQKIHLDFTERVIPNMADSELVAAILGALSYDILAIMNRRVVGREHEVSDESSIKSE